MRSLRSRLLVAIAAAVLVSVGLSLATGAFLVRRSVEHEARRALARQADVLAAQLGATPSPADGISGLGTFLETQQQRLAILSLPQAALLLPPRGADALRAGRGADGSVEVRGTTFLYSARPSSGRAVILLRKAELEAADWRPFGVSFLVAALVGAAFAALAALVLARAVSGPIRRVATASRSLAAGDDPGPLPVSGSEEVAALAEAFNEMASRLARARAAERSFLLSVSHELKTPLAAVAGHAEALGEGIFGPREASEVILRESKRLERLVGDLLDLARLNQRVFTVRHERLDLAEIVREAALRYEAQAQGFGVELVAEPAAEAPAEGDPDRVLQVLSNLIENALRATPAGGTVRVAAGPGTFSVADTGPGLDEDDLPRAFDRFFLHDRYGRERRVGTGLGLAIVKELTEALGGSVEVTSSPGAGATFVVTLPLPAGEPLPLVPAAR